MWTCPKCGRNFRNCNQNHCCGKAPETIAEYIREQPEEVQPVLWQLQETIHGAIPEAMEKISWSMPTFWKGCNLIQFAASQKLGIAFVNAGQWNVELAFDGVHFTEEGHRAFAEGLYTYLTK